MDGSMTGRNRSHVVIKTTLVSENPYKQCLGDSLECKLLKILDTGEIIGTWRGRPLKQITITGKPGEMPSIIGEFLAEYISSIYPGLPSFTEVDVNGLSEILSPRPGARYYIPPITYNINIAEYSLESGRLFLLNIRGDGDGRMNQRMLVIDIDEVRLMLYHRVVGGKARAYADIVFIGRTLFESRSSASRETYKTK